MNLFALMEWITCMEWVFEYRAQADISQSHWPFLGAAGFWLGSDELL